MTNKATMTGPMLDPQSAPSQRAMEAIREATFGPSRDETWETRVRAVLDAELRAGEELARAVDAYLAGDCADSGQHFKAALAAFRTRTGGRKP